MKALVLILDSLPLGFLGCYGNDWIDTPALDRVAAEGVVFDRHYSDHPDSKAARRAWRTGRYAFPLLEATSSTMVESPGDLTRLLRDAGIPNSLIVENRQSGTDSSDWDAVSRIDSENEGVHAAVRLALDRLASGEHRLVWIELASLLPPWNPREDIFDRYYQVAAEGADEIEPVGPLTQLPVGGLAPDDEPGFLRLQSTYGALVTQLDERVQELLDELTRRQLLDDVLLLVTTDRGVALGEHGVVGDKRPCLHSELVHLPLLMRWPAGAEAGRRVQTLTQPVDLMPTLLAAFGVNVPVVHGHNLVPFLRSEEKLVRQYACSGLRRGQALEWFDTYAEWSFLLPLCGDPPRGPQLYAQPEDRWEVNNVIQHHLELAEDLERTLREFVQDPH